MEKASQKEGMKVHPINRPQAGQPSSPGWKGLALLVGAEGAKGREGSRPGASRMGQVGDLGPTFLYEMVPAQSPPRPLGVWAASAHGTPVSRALRSANEEPLQAWPTVSD